MPAALTRGIRVLMINRGEMEFEDAFVLAMYLASWDPVCRIFAAIYGKNNLRNTEAEDVLNDVLRRMPTLIEKHSRGILKDVNKIPDFARVAHLKNVFQDSNVKLIIFISNIVISQLKAEAATGFGQTSLCCSKCDSISLVNNNSILSLAVTIYKDIFNNKSPERR